jgi:hypothetical protein
MSIHSTHSLPTTARLLKATAIALAGAAVILVTAVLPAEYAIDPTGLGAKLGLLSLANTAQAQPAATAAPTTAAQPAPADSATAALAASAASVFGVQPGQSFDARAVARSTTADRTDTMSVTLAPGKGAEIKAMVAAGEGFVFHWTASGEVAVDMHG